MFIIEQIKCLIMFCFIIVGLPCGTLAYDGFGMLYHNCTHRHRERERCKCIYVLDMQEDSEERGGKDGGRVEENRKQDWINS